MILTLIIALVISLYIALLLQGGCQKCRGECSQQSFGRISGGSLRADQSEIRPANILCFFVF